MEQAARYAYKIYLEQSITKAAEKLFISQPALSAAIARHEKELGFQIFNRSTHPITLTPKGRIYIESLGQIIAIEEEMAIRLHESIDLEYQQITVGCYNTAAYYLLSSICEVFSKDHPEVKITIDLGNNGGSDILAQKLLHRKLDFYFCTSKPNIKCTAIQLLQEPLVIAISDQLKIPEALKPFSLSYDALLSPAQSVSPSLFRNIPFIDYFAGTAMFKKMHKILGNYKSTPFRIINAKNAIFHYQLAKNGSGAILLPKSAAIALFSPVDNMRFFYPDHEFATQELYICSHSGNEGSPVMQEFLHTCKSYCQKKRL